MVAGKLQTVTQNQSQRGRATVASYLGTRLYKVNYFTDDGRMTDEDLDRSQHTQTKKKLVFLPPNTLG